MYWQAPMAPQQCQIGVLASRAEDLTGGTFMLLSYAAIDASMTVSS